MSQTAKMLFQSKGIKIPASWDSSLEDKYNQKLDEFKPSVPRPTNIFQSPSMSKVSLDACNTVSEKFEKFIDDICKAICSAWSNWHSSTKFVGVIINAGVGILPPGGMIGGGQMAGPMILSSFPTDPPNYLNHGKAIAMAIGQAWLAWEVGYTNPAIPFPGGMACSTVMPPSPNTPVPIASGMSPGEALLSGAMLKGAMLAQLGAPGEHSEALFDSISGAFNQTFQMWKATAMISNVMGAGGVAPPPPAPPGPVAGAIGSGGAVN